jgi:hypothetical protein
MLYKGAVRLSVSSRVRELVAEKGTEAEVVTLHFPKGTTSDVSGKNPASVTLYRIVGKTVRKENKVGTFRQADTHGIHTCSQSGAAREELSKLFESLPTTAKGSEEGELFYAVYSEAVNEAAPELDIAI